MSPSDETTDNRISDTARLIRLAKGGDNRALTDLYARYGDRLRTIVRFRLGPRLRLKMESCDVVQEALLASLSQFDKAMFLSEGAFLHWLSKIAENRIRDLADHFAARKRDVGRETPLESPESATDAVKGPIAHLATSSTPSVRAMRAEELERLDHAIESLPDDQRDALILVRYTGLSLAEAGEIVERSPDAVRMLVARAIVKLGKHIAATES